MEPEHTSEPNRASSPEDRPDPGPSGSSASSSGSSASSSGSGAFAGGASRSSSRTAGASSDAEAPGKPDQGKRFLARFLDGLIAAVLLNVVTFVVPGYFVESLLGAAAAAAYILLADGLELDFMNRRSIGKHVMNLRPVTLDDAPMDSEKSVLRNGPLAVGYFGVLPWIGWIFGLAGLGLGAYEIYKVLDDPQGRRWGDELAGTRVVEVSARTGPASPGTAR